MCIMVWPWSLRAVISFLESFFFNTVKEAPSKINCAIMGGGYFISFSSLFLLSKKTRKGGPLDDELLFHTHTHTQHPQRAPLCGSWPLVAMVEGSQVSERVLGNSWTHPVWEVAKG